MCLERKPRRCHCVPGDLPSVVGGRKLRQRIKNNSRADASPNDLVPSGVPVPGPTSSN